VTEEYGGDVPLVCVSGKTGEGLDDLKSQVTNRDYGYDSDGQKKKRQ
jgi:hypothetical protein